MARISYILATYNRAAYLEKVFLNIREFITPQDELIIVDSGSTDDTAKLVEANRDIVSVYISEPDFSEHHAINKGILRATGAYIKFLTDDDYFYPEAVRQCIRLLEEHPEIEALQCGGESFVYDPKTGRENFFVAHWQPPSRSFNDGSYDIIENHDYEANGLGFWVSFKTFMRVGLLDITYRAGESEFVTRLIFCRIPIRYFSVKLFKHTVYPHSGATKPFPLYKTRAHLCFTYRCWNKLISGRYSVKDTAEAFGPLQWRHILFLNKAFISRRLKKIKGLRASLNFFYRPATALFRYVKRLLSKVPAPAEKIQPIWDGSLR